MMDVDKSYDIGAIVSWQTEDSLHTGTIEKVFRIPFEVESDRTFDASVDNPAYVITAADGLEVIKRHADVKKIDPVGAL